MAIDFLTSLNLNQNELINAVAHHVAVDPSEGNVEGRLIYNSTDKKFKYWNGTNWEALSAVSIPEVITVAQGGTGVKTLAAGEVVVGNGTDAVTTKAIDTVVTEESTNLITSGAVKTYTDEAITSAVSTIEVMNFKGTIAGNGLITSDDDTINAQNFFTLTNIKKGWTFIASEAISTATSTLAEAIEPGDMIVAVKDASAFATDVVKVIQANIDGAVTGPSSATANNLASFDGNTGNVIKDSGVAITDVSQAISDVATLKTHQHTIEVGEGLSGGGTIGIGETATVSLATSGATAGTYGANTTGTATAGSTINVPEIVVDSYGRVTSIATKTLTVDDFGKGTVKKYTESNTSLTPADGVCTWTVTHNLGTTACTVTITDTNNKVVYADVQFASENTAVVTINSASTIVAGTYTITITG